MTSLSQTDQQSIQIHPPTGMVTFLFTDIEGSTRLAQQYPELWESAKTRHHEILNSAAESYRGYVFQIVGDAFYIAFHTACDAVRAATIAQRNFYKEAWGYVVIKVRMGIHTGQAKIKEDGDYIGFLTMARTQRVASAAYGGQVLLSLSAQELIYDEIDEGVSFSDLGERQFKDLSHPLHVYQLVIPGIPSEFPELKILSVQKHNLPTQVTSFIGREKEKEEIKQVISESRLVTLTGSGGTGKTRLGLQVAEEILNEFPDGVWLVELASLADSSLILHTILNTLGLREQKGQDALHVLLDFLAGKEILLVLDNCEHLIVACAELSSKLLANSPNLKILASSREALGVSGEVIRVVPSLDVPEIKTLPEVTKLSEYEAVRLFAERARSVQPQFSLTEENANDVAQICIRLDGIPLAIELAAARMKMFSTGQIVSRLDDCFHLLTSGTRTALPHQKTLRATIEWSYGLLTEEECILFQRLSVFVSSWRLRMAEQICSDEKLERDDVLEVLGRLVDKSLVVVDEGISGKRYRYLETVHQYAREKLLESGEWKTLQNRHLGKFLAFAEQVEPEWCGPNQATWRKRLEDEHDNLRSALEWGLEHDPEACLRLASALYRFFDLRDSPQEALKWLEKALFRTEIFQTVDRARALAKAAGSAASLYLEEKSEQYAKEAFELGTRLDDKVSMAHALFILGALESDQNQIESCLEHLERASEYAKESGNHALTASILYWYGDATADETGDSNSAIPLIERGLQEARLAGGASLISRGLFLLGVHLTMLGRLEQARDYLEETLQRSQKLDAKWSVSYCYLHLFIIAMNLDDHVLAEEYLVEASHHANLLNQRDVFVWYLTGLSILHWAKGNQLGFTKYAQEALEQAEKGFAGRYFLAFVYLVRGEAYRLAGKCAQAKSMYKTALETYQEVFEKYSPLCFYGFAALLLTENQFESSVLLFAAADCHPRTFWLDYYNYPFCTRERKGFHAKAREEMGKENFQAAWNVGLRLSREGAVAMMEELLKK